MKISTYKNEVKRHIHQLARVPPINVKGFPIYQKQWNTEKEKNKIET